MKDINEQVLNTMQVLKRDPKRLIENTYYDTYHAYIEGYVDGVSMTLSNNLRREITSFYEAQGNIKTNYHWTSQIRHRNKGKTDNELVEILLETTKEYFLKNSDWCNGMDHTKLKKELPVWFVGFKNWPGMFIQIDLSLPVYLEAFVDGLNVYSNKNLRLEISRWFNQKTGQEETFHWANQITDFYTGKYEDTNKKFSEVTEEFFETNIIF